MGMYCSLRVVKPLELARLMAGDNEADDPIPRHESSPTLVSLEKAWHGLHYLLTVTMPDGGPLAFGLERGEPVGEDLGYGPARVLHHDEGAGRDAALAV